MYQRQQRLCFASDANVAANQEKIAPVAKPPPVPSAPQAVFVRPDRQIVYSESASPADWPDPKSLHNPGTITIDRTHIDIDGPPHRFVVKCFDQVEVFLSAERIVIGEVTEICHRRREVRVSVDEGGNGVWFPLAQIYPATDERAETSRHHRRTVPLSAKVDPPQFPGPVATNHDSRPAPTSTAYSFDDFLKFRRDFAAGHVTFDDYRAQFERLLTSQDSIKAELLSRFKAPELVALAKRLGSWFAKRATKQENAESIVTNMLSAFLLDGTISYRFGERYQDAIRAKVLAVTADEYAREFERRQAASQEQAKALTNPETFYEFRTFILAKGEENLSDQQLAAYDALHADMTRARRQKTNTVDRFGSEALKACSFVRKEGFHDMRQCPLYIVQLTSRVERDAFQELNRKAKMLGGWYSSFKKEDAGLCRKLRFDS